MNTETKYLLSQIEACLTCGIASGPEVKISAARAKDLVNQIKIVRKALTSGLSKKDRLPYYEARLDRIFA